MKYPNTIILIFLVFIDMACHSENISSLSPSQEEQIAKINAQSTLGTNKSASKLQLAIELEISQADIKPISVTIIRAVSRNNSALADLQVQAKANDKIVADYLIPNPRLVEIEREGNKLIPRARTIVHVPLRDDLTELQITPVSRRVQDASRTIAIDLRPLIKQACEKRREIDVCQEVLKQAK